MKVIFLDIDGVIAGNDTTFASKEYKRQQFELLFNEIEDYPYPIDDIGRNLLVRDLYHLNKRTIGIEYNKTTN